MGPPRKHNLIYEAEACRPDSPVIDPLADFRLHYLHDGANKRTRRVILPTVPARVTHILDLGFVKLGELVLFSLRPEAQFVDVVDDVAQAVAAMDLLAEDFADLRLPDGSASLPVH